MVVPPALPALSVTASSSAALPRGSVPIARIHGNPFAILPEHDPTIAMCLSIAVDGAGQFYNGQPAKGWWMLGSWLVYPLAWGLDSALHTGYFRTGALIAELGVKGYSAWDAYHDAAAYRQARLAGSDGRGP